MDANASRLVSRVEMGYHLARPTKGLPTMPTVTIDNKEYDLDSLSNEVKQHIVNLQLCDQDIQRLQIQLGIAQTARGAYSNALNAELPKTPAFKTESIM